MVNDTERNQFLDKWLSDLDGYYAERISDLDADYAKRRQQLEFEYQRKREAIREIWSEDTDKDAEKASPVSTQEAPSSNGVNASTLNGPTNQVAVSFSRRDLARRIIPEFHGETFTASDIREKFLEQYLETEPPNFPQAINNLLKRMVDSGEIEEAGRQGEGDRAPWLYREKRSQEENLLEP